VVAAEQKHGTNGVKGHASAINNWFVAGRFEAKQSKVLQQSKQRIDDDIVAS